MISTDRFSQTVFVVTDDNRIEEHTLADLCHEYAETTTSPNGVTAKLHLRGTELWTWGHMGQSPRRLDEFATEEEAEAALLGALYDELTTDGNLRAPEWFRSRAEAETEVRDREEGARG